MKTMMLFLFLIPLYSQANQYEFYHQRYSLPDVYTKLIDNHGDGFEELYGIRNFRSILKGFLYRGGANNKWHRGNRRDNMNPLPDDGLMNLCKEGFSKSVYLYNTRFETAPEVTRCESIHNKRNKLKYINLVAHRSDEVLEIIKIIHSTVTNNGGPIYLHCWNGWHASGMISAVALKQFCGFENPELIDYWNRNTDGHNNEPQYEKIRDRIRNFVPLKEYAISEELQDRLCPDTL